MPERDPQKKPHAEEVKAVLGKIGATGKYEPLLIENFSRFVAKRPQVFAEEDGELIESSVKSCLKFYATLHEFHEGDVVEVEKSLDRVNARLTATLLEKKLAGAMNSKKVRILFG